MHTKKIQLLLLLVCLGCLFLCSCGLDEYYVIEPPVALREVSPDTDSQTEMYYQFWEKSKDDTFYQVRQRGCAVYYSLYSDKTKLTSDINRIKSVNKEYSENGFNTMKSAAAYQPMMFTGSQTSEFLNLASSEETYTIELTTTTVEPGSSSQIDLLIVTRASDNAEFHVSITKPDEPGEWYINAYAVNVGDVSLVEHYSALAPLGALHFTVQ